jgi:c-di-AMP phosphodiesterase-like protein
MMMMMTIVKTMMIHLHLNLSRSVYWILMILTIYYFCLQPSSDLIHDHWDDHVHTINNTTEQSSQPMKAGETTKVAIG